MEQYAKGIVLEVESKLCSGMHFEQYTCDMLYGIYIVNCIC